LAQNNLTINHNKDGASSITKKLKKGQSYKVVIANTHDWVMSLKSQVISYDVISKTPDITKFLSIPSTDVTRDSYSFRNAEKGRSEVENNLKKIILLVDKYDKFYRTIKSKIDVVLAKWPDDAIRSDMLIEIASEASNDEITKEDILQIQYLLAENELWAAFINSLSLKENDDSFLSSIDVFTKFMAKRELLKTNSSRYIQVIKVMDDILNPSDSINSNYLVGDSFTTRGDLTKINYAIKNKLTSDTLAVGSIVIPTYNHWALDFSTGFYWNRLSNDTYSLSEYSADSTTITFINDYSKSSDIAVGGQLNLSYMATGTLGLGINTGAAVSLFDGSIKYLFGGHLKIGSRKQIMFSGGLAIGKVKQVSEAVSSDPLYQEFGNQIVVPGKFPEPKFVDKMQSSIYFGLSYNLSSVLTKRK